MRIAIIGTGISGMVTGHLLNGEHDLTLYEAGSYVGGHTHTVDVERQGKRYAVDTGFIVFNPENYPNFVKLMRSLGVPSKKSSMSFSVHCEKTGFEYRPSSLDTLFAQRGNLFKPWFWKMVKEIFRFRNESESLLAGEADETTTLGEFLNERAYSEKFKDYFIIPMGAAIWSAGPERFERFPARYFAEFFANHGFLKTKDQPRWQVIEGGSRAYVDPLTRPFRDRIRINSRVRKVRRLSESVEVETEGEPAERFDEVIIAAHSDQALAMVENPTPQEREVLGAIAYQENETVLHTDASLLPANRKVWASWNYRIPRNRQDRVAVTYNMNELQGLDAKETFCVTLNQTGSIDPEKVIKRMTYTHPVFTPEARAAQKRHAEISGADRIHYCGAYWGYGFHEDGVKSALAVGRQFGKGL
ncbi:MAG: FAD-dependent oxidoreductase [Planctomycetota bacterium]